MENQFSKDEHDHFRDQCQITRINCGAARVHFILAAE